MSLPTTRRIVTGHDQHGHAIFDSDETLTPANPLDSTGGPPSGIIPGFTNLFRTDGVPAKAQGPWDDVHGKKIGLVSPAGVYARIVDFPPTGDAEDSVNIMHRTQSVDFAVVLKGSIKLILDEGVEKTVREGDTVVQRATNHAWKNVSNENVRILFVLVPSEPVVNESTGEVLEPTPTHLLEEKQD
ncbi:hypothetical protein LTR84_011076 [Exophiala bonariae]|uniref:Cupin type-2 domain-containing protein n=1 Tax=Exophiala bonariae TaxID=1690606 RepID=A0AAV9NJ86_9EURO|nr:hypothetical protein LTR84_011076 [Exophiala bonariae]